MAETKDGVELEQTVVSLRQRSAQLEKRLFDYETLLKAAEALNEELQAERVGSLTLALMLERVAAEWGALICHDGSNRRLSLLCSQGYAKPEPSVDIVLEEGILWRMCLAGSPFHVVDGDGSSRFASVFAESGLGTLDSQLWVPLVTKDTLVGVVCLGGMGSATPGVGSLDTRDELYLESLAGQAAVALAGARLYARVVEARKELGRSVHSLSMLFDVSRALAAVSDLAELLGLILRRSVEAVGAEKGSLMLLDEASDELVVRVAIGLPDPALEKQIESGEIECSRFGRGEGVAGRVLETGKPLLVGDVGNDDLFMGASGSHARTLLCLPLVAEGEVIGVINITNRPDDKPFGEEDLDVLQALSSQAAVAISRTRLYEMVIRDDLTGLLVRRFVLDRLATEARRSLRYKQPLAVIMCDIDHFKAVNDNHGHPAGDAVLAGVGALLKRELRTGVDMPGRYGGEEFVLVMPQTNASDAAVAAERIRAGVECTPTEVDGKTLRISMSFGVAQLDLERGESWQELVKRADKALYAAKRGGRNRVELASVLEPAEPS